MTSRTDAFTLIELLLVIVILGIVAAVTMPIIGAGTSSTRLAVGARTAIQAARYARTMALLHQAETMLAIGLEDGTLRVEAAPAGGENAVAPADPEAGGNTLSAAGDDRAAGDDPHAAYSNRPAAALTARSFADELRVEYRCEDVKFAFRGYADSAGGLEEEAAAPASAPAGERREAIILYRSNGTCRPFRLRVLRDEEEWLDIDFDVTGAGKVVRDE